MEMFCKVTSNELDVEEMICKFAADRLFTRSLRTQGERDNTDHK